MTRTIILSLAGACAAVALSACSEQTQDAAAVAASSAAEDAKAAVSDAAQEGAVVVGDVAQKGAEAAADAARGAATKIEHATSKDPDHPLESPAAPAT